MSKSAKPSTSSTAHCRIGGLASWLIVLTLSTSISALSGCASGTAGTRDRTAFTPALLVKAPTTLPAAKSATLPDLMANHAQTAEQYHKVARRLNALIDEVTTPEEPAARWWQVWRRAWWRR